MWIARPFTEEHRGALDWLNEITDERFNFLDPVVRVRNDAAHDEAVDSDRVSALRAQVVGIDEEGLLVRVARGKGRG